MRVELQNELSREAFSKQLLDIEPHVPLIRFPLTEVQNGGTPPTLQKRDIWECQWRLLRCWTRREFMDDDRGGPKESAMEPRLS
ncbi:unnamed protein product [Pieris macdunnoughi]|uniref:Uncharacterized protein n=1 Tax=Pieris macdunnoughi TaxID=345717 RepID=A0A821UGB1_9NEOP|nr:unnamed protein product [Pieris macdunnoughi]